MTGLALTRRMRWPETIATGALWGIAVSIMEPLVIPVPDSATFWTVVLWILPGWCIVGMCIAFLVETFGPRLARRTLAIPFWLAFAVLLSGLWSWIYSREWALRHSGMAEIFPHGVDPVAAFAYQTWIVLFYGGLYFAAWILNHRAAEMRETLGQAEIARARAETLLAQARLDLLLGHVEPGLLRRSLVEIERRYSSGTAHADRLLASLVEFLRLAMPAVRSGRSSLAAELALARSYGELIAAIGPDAPTWTIEGDPPPDIPFPALLLMPLLDASGTAVVRVASEHPDVVVNLFTGPGAGALSPGLERRIRAGLAALHGDSWSLAYPAVANPDGPALQLRIRLSQGGNP